MADHLVEVVAAAVVVVEAAAVEAVVALVAVVDVVAAEGTYNSLYIHCILTFDVHLYGTKVLLLKSWLCKCQTLDSYKFTCICL